MIKAILIDDEKSALEVLAIQLAKHCPDVHIAAECMAGDEGIAAIRLWEPDVVFLDITMPYKNGFEIIKETQDYNYSIIFVTAYNQYAIQAFKVAAVDYLLKPFEPVELQAAVEKVRQKQALTTAAHERIQSIWEISNRAPAYSGKKVAISTGDTIEFFKSDEIIRCESQSNYTVFYFQNGQKITIAKTLKEVEESLTGLSFYRIHQSHLINMLHVVRVLKGDGGYVMMRDGINIAISRQRRDAFLEFFHRL